LRDKRQGLGYNAAPMRLITTTDELAKLCQRLAQHDFVAVDTEFIREQTYWPRLCLIQMAGPEDEALVDPLSPGISLEPFFALMAEEAVVKVFHAARQDLEIVWNQARLIPHPIFDTQVAAMVCGFGESVSYVNLVKQIAHQDLDKTSRFTDWSRRPLSQQQLAYALGDVTHLRGVYRRLKAELAKGGPGELARRGDGGAHRSAHLRGPPRGSLAPSQAAHQEPQGAGRADRARRLARAGRAGSGRAAQPRPARRGALRHRQPRADGGCRSSPICAR
jgi:ribonuclease D